MSSPLAKVSTTMLMNSSLGRLRVFYLALLNMSANMGGNTPVEVLQKFVELLAQTGPRLQTLVSVITPWALLITAITEHDWIRETYDGIKDGIMSYIDTSVEVFNGHEMHGHLLRWMSGTAFGQEVRTLQPITPDWTEAQMEPPVQHHADANTSNGLLLHYAPTIGRYSYVFEGHRITIDRIRVQRPDDEDDSDFIRISCLSPFAGARVLKRFLDHVRRYVVAKMVNHTYVYRVNHRHHNWDCHAKPSRNLNAVTLDQHLKNAMVHDIGAYLDPKSRRYYSNRGIPWRRGFLFYGPPGTGKTSFTTALAGHFGLSVFVLSLSSSQWDDGKLEHLFMQIPTRCIVLIEDIDSAGIQREQMRVPETTPPSRSNKWLSRIRGPAKPMGDMPPAGITLSGLLNVIDGMHSTEGRILILTSNNPDSLDEALLRRGRVDQRVFFGYASRAVAAELFEHVFVKAADELLENELPRDREEIAELAQEFADSFPPDRLTPADVQGFLLDHRADPVAAVQRVGGYADHILWNREMGMNVDSSTEGSLKGVGFGRALRSVWEGFEAILSWRGSCVRC